MAGIGKYEGAGNFKMKTPAKYGMDRTPAMYTPYKMKKGSPMYRNFGVGDAPEGGVASPNKGWFSKIGKGIKKAAGGAFGGVKKALGIGTPPDEAPGAAAAADPVLAAGQADQGVMPGEMDPNLQKLATHPKFGGGIGGAQPGGGGHPKFAGADIAAQQMRGPKRAGPGGMWGGSI